MALRHLLLLRHGEANQSSPDHLRELTGAGRKELSKSLIGAQTQAPELDAIFHSGLTRAAQTADMAAQLLAPQLQPKLMEGISPSGEVQRFPEYLESESLSAVLLVTHNPFVEELVIFLSGENLLIKTGALVCLEVDFLSRGCCNISFIQN
tara:strand:- start:61576 stop:62028 length:453 start_codon:yes stop_codon:yes gene_type:complete